MQQYCESVTEYKRLKTREVKVGNLLLGNGHPIRVQTMTTTDSMDTLATVEQSIRCIEAGAELVRITAPSKKEAENLRLIKDELNRRGYFTPLVADIHFTPNAAEIAARIVEKVRVNPGNYVDKKKFEQIEYTDAEYLEEIERITERFTPLVLICKEHGTAMRIGTNHGSLSDRIMSRYGDTAMGMVESAMEFLRIARAVDYHQIILSMKSSNPQVMVQAYRLLVNKMQEEFGECYPLHLGVTEAGDGEDGRVKSAAGIGTLLEDGIGDTIRVSLTEDPEFEVPVCRDLVKRYQEVSSEKQVASSIPVIDNLPYSPFEYRRREAFGVDNIGGKHVPVVIADLSKMDTITAASLQGVGYTYDEATDKWHISDAAADYIFTGKAALDFSLPGTLKVVTWPNHWQEAADKSKYFPIYDAAGFAETTVVSDTINFVMVDCYSDETAINDYTHLDTLANNPTVVICLSSTHQHAMPAVRRMFMELLIRGIKNPVVLITDSNWSTPDEHLIHYATETGALFLDGFGDGICLGMTPESYKTQASSIQNASGRNYTNNTSVEQFINSTAFTILQATRTRISKTEYISCPSCGRTLFDLQETTAKIRARTNHLKGVKIAIMGCIVNGPGEMADADFGYVGSGVGKITLYKGKEVVKRNVDSNIAVDELIGLLKENEAWVEPIV
ncbi:MAG: (E)-4-hydroxy-3-methylbut-2-enyl-diphosphate synthase [Bacteroidota bacterium]